MPNHIHFLARLKNHQVLEPETKSNKQITQPFSNQFNSYTKAYNKKYNRMGSLFIPNFKRKPIEDNDYLTRVILYIHLNPVHHGFVKFPSLWEWSSFNIIADEGESWIKKNEVINWFGTKEKFLNQHLTDLQGL
ncbi:MAG: hypothetical protein KF725_11170 [Cyclobacteriaceae bacterium]|nr:hypothetical protein [Cyclobacteriaceae bacterium]UYN86267.1 MAG: hypothetical protein KIT51_15560 [Cyclobacteriaceae bacterium]